LASLRGLLRLQRFKGSQYPIRTRVDPYRRDIAPANHPLGIKHKQGSFTRPIVSTIYPIHFGDCPLGLEVCEQGKVQLPVLGKSGVTPDPIDGDADQLGMEVAKLRQDLVIEGHLVTADRAPIDRIEGENYRLT